MRSIRAWCHVANEPGWIHAVAPLAPGSRVTTAVATRDSSSRSWLMKSTVLSLAMSRSSSQRFDGHVEVVVRLVEEEQVGRTVEQGLEHDALLFASRQGGDGTPLSLLERHTQCLCRDRVPDRRLVVVAAGVAPVREGLGVGHLRGLVVDLHDEQLGGVDGQRGLADAFWRNGDQQVAHGRVVADLADELVHHREGPGRGDWRPRAR